MTKKKDIGFGGLEISLTENGGFEMRGPLESLRAIKDAFAGAALNASRCCEPGFEYALNEESERMFGMSLAIERALRKGEVDVHR